MGKGFSLAEEGHVINALPPISMAGGKTSDYWNMKNYAHADIIITLGAAVNVSAITVFQSEDAAGAGEDAIGFKYYSETTAQGDVLDRQTDAGAGGFNSASAGTADTMHVISVDAADLAAGHPFMCVKLTSAGAQLGAVIVVLSGARYQAEPTASALA
jgi:hypothetical protein